MWLIITWIVLVTFVFAFIFSASKNNEEYDLYVSQQKCFDKYVNNELLVFTKYIGNDRHTIKHGEYGLIMIKTTDNNKIAVELSDTFILYDDFKHFYCDWRFND